MAGEEEEKAAFSRDAKNSSRGFALDRAADCFAGALVIGALEGDPDDAEEAKAFVTGARADRSERLLLRSSLLPRPRCARDFSQ